MFNHADKYKNCKNVNICLPLAVHCYPKGILNCKHERRSVSMNLFIYLFFIIIIFWG